MTHDKKFKNESQDARRHDKHNETHPEDKMNKNPNKSTQNPGKSTGSSAASGK